MCTSFLFSLSWLSACWVHVSVSRTSQQLKAEASSQTGFNTSIFIGSSEYVRLAVHLCFTLSFNHHMEWRVLQDYCRWGFFFLVRGAVVVPVGRVVLWIGLLGFFFFFFLCYHRVYWLCEEVRDTEHLQKASKMKTSSFICIFELNHICNWLKHSAFNNIVTKKRGATLFICC